MSGERRERKTVIIENTGMIFRNFAGKAGKYNDAGRRNFCIFIDDNDLAQKMSDEGWNVRILRPREEGDEPRHYLKIKVAFRDREGNLKSNPPKIYMVTRRGKMLLDEESVDTLDYADISNVDVEFAPSYYEKDGETGISAYLRTLYAVIEEDAFAEKYASEEYPGEREN